MNAQVERFCPTCGAGSTSASCPNDGTEMKPVGVGVMAAVPPRLATSAPAALSPMSAPVPPPPPPPTPADWNASRRGGAMWREVPTLPAQLAAPSSPASMLPTENQIPTRHPQMSDRLATWGLISVMAFSLILPLPFPTTVWTTQTYQVPHTGYQTVTYTNYPNYVVEWELNYALCSGDPAPGSEEACMHLFNTGNVSGTFEIKFTWTQTTGYTTSCTGSSYVQAGTSQYISCVTQVPSCIYPCGESISYSVTTPPPQVVSQQVPYTYYTTETRQVAQNSTTWTPLLFGAPTIGLPVAAVSGALAAVVWSRGKKA